MVEEIGILLFHRLLWALNYLKLLIFKLDITTAQETFINDPIYWDLNESNNTRLDRIQEEVWQQLKPYDSLPKCINICWICSGKGTDSFLHCFTEYFAYNFKLPVVACKQRNQCHVNVWCNRRVIDLVGEFDWLGCRPDEVDALVDLCVQDWVEYDHTHRDADGQKS